MKKILFTLCFCLLAFNANAQIRCHEDSLGYRNCSGTNSDGEYVNIRSHNQITFTFSFVKASKKPHKSEAILFFSYFAIFVKYG